MTPALKSAIETARFHTDKGIELHGDAMLVLAANEIDRLRAELDRLRSGDPQLTCDSCIHRDTCPKRGTACMYHDDDISKATTSGEGEL